MTSTVETPTVERPGSTQTKHSLPWSIYDLKEAYKERPPIEYVVEGLFPTSSLSIVYGPPGTLKSLFLIDMGMCVAAGLPWLQGADGDGQNKRRKTKQVPVLYIDVDNGKNLTDERAEAAAKAHGLSPDTPFFYTSFPDPHPDFSRRDFVNILIAYCHEQEVGMIVIDNLRNVSGGVDENHSEMATVMANLRRLAEQTGTAVVVIHHQSKGGGDNHRRAGDSLRGHSSIEAALDLALRVKRDGENLTVESTKTRRADVEPFRARFIFTHKENTQDMATAMFVATDAKTESGQVIKVIMDTVGEKGFSDGKAAFEKKVQERCVKINVNWGVNKIGEQIENLVMLGTLVAQTGERGKHIYLRSTDLRSSTGG
jgi:hypothetical protein